MPNTARRIVTRLDESLSQKLQAAADLSGATLDQFVVQAAIEKADKLMETDDVLRLTGRESERLLALLENPPPRNAKFQAALSRFRLLNRDAGPAA